MTRRHVTFGCEGAVLYGTVDLPAEGNATGAGLLLVSGGNETRAGAWNGQAALAARLAAAGVAVFRFDRRGVGDSEGENRGFRHSADDIAAALAAFRAEVPGLERSHGLGNCDAASALMLGGGCGLDGLILSNPWTIEEAEAPPPPAVLRAHYAGRLRDPAALLRLLRGKVSLGQLLRSLRDLRRPAERSGLAGDMAAGLAGFAGPVAILLAGRDRTAQAFRAEWDKSDPRVIVCPQATHSFVEPGAQAWLEERILAAVEGRAN